MCALRQAIIKASQQLPRKPVSLPLRLPLTLTEPVDLTSWLAAQPCFPKFFWHSRDRDLQVASLGTHKSFSGQQALEQLHNLESAVRYYWLAGFDLEAELPPLLFIPALELIQEDGQLWLQLNSDQAFELLTRLQPCQALDSQPLKVTHRQDTPDWPQWQQAVNQAHRQFSDGCLQKVVLARQTDFQHQQQELFWPFFKRWQQRSQNAYQIAYQTSPTEGFISFTPERLFQREANQITTEALAATLPRGNNPELARNQAKSLFNDDKSRHEHALVVVEIEAKLAALGIELNRSCGTGLLQQPGLHHLHQLIQGHLKTPMMDAALLQTLHPTAAICGLPTNNARRFINQHEPFDRDLYAGSCGYFSQERSELAVTIRSARLQQQRLSLYAGAGIVPLSDPWAEWQELESKIGLPLDCIDIDIEDDHNRDIDSSSIA